MKRGKSTFLILMVTIIGILLIPSCEKATDESFFDITADGLVGVDETKKELLPSEVVIPKKIKGIAVREIKDVGFEECNNLESIIIPKGVIAIGFASFYNCSNLTSITIPKSVKTIGGVAFSSCNSLASITIPNGVTSIGAGAFDYSRNLESITIPKSVTFIGKFAFNECSSLESITIPKSVTTIEHEVFNGCSSLESINYLGTVKQWNALNITDLGDNFPAAYVSCSDGQVKL